MQKVFNSLKEIEEVVKELLPPRVNHLINSFKLEFKLSSNNWKNLNEIFHNLDYVLLLGPRGIEYYISKASIQDEIDFLSSLLDPDYEYSDDHFYWQSQLNLRAKIAVLKKQHDKL
jgi:hypothetical protein